MNKSHRSFVSQYSYVKGTLSLGGKICGKFDPASISKIFYAFYLFHTYPISRLREQKLQLKLADVHQYGRGTRKLGWFDIGREYSLVELITFSIQNSCNIATGMLADFLGRDDVNKFIHQQLKLIDTTVYDSIKTPNRTTCGDLSSCLQQIYTSDFLSDQARTHFLDILLHNERRTVIKNTLPPHFTVYSKGGTTFSGLRRDAAIIVDASGEVSYLVVVQTGKGIEQSTIPQRILAKLGIGELHHQLISLDQEFNHKVKALLQQLSLVK